MIRSILLLLLAAPAFAHGEDPPPWYIDPTGTGACGAPSGEAFVEPYGTQPLTAYSSWYYGSSTWYPYQVLNGSSTRPSCNGFSSAYLSAGDLGNAYSMSLRRISSQSGQPFPETSVGWTTWADDWAAPYYSPFGWTMLAGNVIDTWAYTPQERVYINGEFFGWQRFGVWPNDPALHGVKVFYQSFVHDPSTNDTRFSAPWSLTFVDPALVP